MHCVLLSLEKRGNDEKNKNIMVLCAADAFVCSVR